MQAYILRSNSGTRFRFGEALGAYTEEQSNSQKTTSEFLHSDTLWSALVNAWAFCHPDTVEEFISECKNGKFTLSSAFYCVDYKGKSVFFLPKPASLNLFKFEEPKKLKKIKFISKGIWENGLLPDKWFNADECTFLQNDSIVALKSEIDTSIKIFTTETNPKVRARDINDREDRFFYQTDLFLLNGDNFNVSWYFLIENNLSDNLQNDFKNAVQTLVNFGIGGERTSGCGSLTECVLTDFAIRTKTSNFYSNLSLIAPDEKELTGNSFYQIIKRGGRFLEKGKCLPMIQMLLEGAVFDTKIKGRIVTLNENPPILRFGLNLSIPLHENFIDNEL
ncbi:MAG: type III-A CRISPR-associated RAMP protein Csm4 [Bacteroidales bacterium]|jgi:CRISPR-associated protein Csm4|nr:type III-A CRISPR-associated RAMP protein Csm4 [Bacteroidales bacterium]